MTPENPVVGGTALRIPAIKSPNFAHLVAGWSINQDGTAEFNGLTINGGQLILTDGSGNVVGTLDGTNGLVLYGNGTALDPGLTINAFGDLVWGGDNTLTDDPRIEIGGTFDDQGNGHPALFIFSGARDAGKNACVVTIYGADSTGAHPGGMVIGDGFLVGNDPTVSSTPPGTPESWHALTLANGWAAAGAPFDTPSYRLNALGAVEFKGLATGGTHTAGTVVATLPAQYRPAKTRQVVASADGNTSPFCCVLHIQGTNDTNPGQIQIFEGTSTAAAIGFDGLSFYLT